MATHPEETRRIWTLASKRMAEGRVRAASNRPLTKPERAVSDLLPAGMFRRNVQVRCDDLIKEVDFVGPFLVEVDGLRHFLPCSPTEEAITQIHDRDVALNRWCQAAGKTLIRLAADVFLGDQIRERWFQLVAQTLIDPPIGVTLIGNLYLGVDLPHDRLLTLK